LLWDEEPESYEGGSTFRVTDESPKTEQASSKDEQADDVRLKLRRPPKTGNEGDSAIKDEEDAGGTVEERSHPKDGTVRDAC
jgi:hypothetical protein